jgi:hypothetical protein
VTGTIYRCWSGARLLYVGKTKGDPDKRLSGHRATAEWWDEVTEVTLEQVPLAGLAQVEAAAVACERPAYNVVHRHRVACWWCNDWGVIVGPWYAIVRCPACSGGAWWPPYPAPFEHGPVPPVEAEVEPRPSGYLSTGYIPARLRGSGS